MSQWNYSLGVASDVQFLRDQSDHYGSIWGACLGNSGAQSGSWREGMDIGVLEDLVMIKVQSCTVEG